MGAPSCVILAASESRRRACRSSNSLSNSSSKGQGCFFFRFWICFCDALGNDFCLISFDGFLVMVWGGLFKNVWWCLMILNGYLKTFDSYDECLMICGWLWRDLAGWAHLMRGKPKMPSCVFLFAKPQKPWMCIGPTNENLMREFRGTNRVSFPPNKLLSSHSAKVSKKLCQADVSWKFIEEGILLGMLYLNTRKIPQ